MGRSECGKTTLTQALSGDRIAYHKTQYVNFQDAVIDTPGEYAEVAALSRALALYSYEADVVALLLSSTEPYSLYPPNCAAVCTRPVFGIVTKIDDPTGDVAQAHMWLELAGCSPVFHVSSYTGAGLWDVLNYLKEDGDILPWASREEAERPRDILSDKFGDLPQ